jgi:type I restriction enzyme S subunit
MNTFSAVMKKSSRGIMDMRLRLYFDKFGDIRVPFPPYKEQLEIAKFLDKKTEQIDEAIAIKEKQIALLKERKQIITQQAVTQGLDPNVPMKDSGVEWIGRIPKHWHYEPIKYSLKGIVDCEHKTAPFVDEEEFFVVRTTNVKDGKINLTGAKYTHAKGYKEWTRRGIPTPGDILLTREAPAGEACTVPEDLKLCLGQRMVWLKVDRTRLVPEFGVALIYSSIGRTYIDFLSAGSTVLHFNMSDIANIPVVLPPLDEQKALVEYINCKSVEIENSSKILSQQIEKLREYKTTLINSAVTGKIKVA